ncbi:hypothetical protein ACFL6U_00715 [Planctomycetota bacterium]
MKRHEYCFRCIMMLTVFVMFPGLLHSQVGTRIGTVGKQCIDFEDPKLKTMYHVMDSFTDSGATIRLTPFQWSNGKWSNEGNATIERDGHAGGSGQEVWINNVNLSTEFSWRPNALSLRFGEYGGNLNININNDFRNFNTFSEIHASVIGGVFVSIAKGFSNNIGTLTLEGEIHTFAIGGQELAIDDICSEVEESPNWECYQDLPSPELVYTGTEDYTVSGNEFTRYLLSVVNRFAFPDELFAPASDLPPCDLNTNSSRTWVAIYAGDGTRIYGFCALSSAEDLDRLWFALPRGDAPPECVYITLTDRRCNLTYTSNCVPLMESEGLQCIDFEDPPLQSMYYVPDSFTDSGATIRLIPFQWPGGTWTNNGYAVIQNDGLAGGSGQEAWINNVNLSIEFPWRPDALSLQFGEYGGNLNMEINGDFINFENFSEIHASVIGGCDVFVSNGFGNDKGSLTLVGEIHSFAIGGQELVIDDICPEAESDEIYFADGGESTGSVYFYDPAVGETAIYTRPDDRLYSFCFSPWDPNKLYFVNANKNNILVKDLSISASLEAVLYTHTTHIRDIAFNNEGTLFFSEATGAEHNGKIWQIEKDGTTSLYYTVSLATVSGFWSGDFTFDHSNTLYLSSGNHIPAQLYKVDDVHAGTVTTEYTDTHGSIAGMVFGEDGFLYYANWETKIYCLNLANGQRAVIYSNPSRTWVSDVGFKSKELPLTDAKGIWIMPYGIGGTRLDQIKPTGLTDYTDSLSGHFMHDAPFGSRLGFRLGSANLIPTPAITYYRFQYKHESGATWYEFTEPVMVHYVKEALFMFPKFPTYMLGPYDVAGKKLYKFRPHEADLPSLVPVAPGETVSWPSTGFLGDIYSGFLNTESLHLAPGRYTIKLEIFNHTGAQVLPAPGTFNFVVPSGVGPGGTIFTNPAGPGSMDAGGFVFTVHVDNRSCGAQIHEPMIGSIGAGDCGFLRYNPAVSPSTAPVNISFNATHPADFALFLFRIIRGPHLVSPTYVNGAEVNALFAGTYTGDGNGHFENDFLRTDLLGPCVEGAFSENLYSFAKATNGWKHRLNKFDASDVRAFALTPY